MRKRTREKVTNNIQGDNSHKQMLLFKRNTLYFSSVILLQSTIEIRQYPSKLVMVYGAQIALEFKTIKSNNTGEVDRLNTCSGNLPCEIKSTSLSGIFPSETIEVPRLVSFNLIYLVSSHISSGGYYSHSPIQQEIYFLQTIAYSI